MITIRKDTNNARELLLRLGMGNYNATLAIQYMFTAPAATDPDMPSIIMMTKHLQQGLRAAGATDVMVTGQIDDPTARALIRLVGPDWNQVTWYALFTAVIEAKRAGTLAASGPTVQLGVLPDLPAVPGGMMTLALGAVAIYFILRKRKA